MRYIGVDLAWGERARTGLAMLDGSGRLIASASVRTDEEIIGFVSSSADDALVATVDAPLIVPNETGRRPCEAEIGQLFARFGAGAHPANRSNPAFNPEPRGARLARSMGWDMDPSIRPGQGRHVCVEVYPHPAMVSLFGLDYVIPYKVKQGREIPALKASYQRLLDHMQVAFGDLLDLGGSGRWAHLRDVAATAQRKHQLNAIEDEIDAIFCAYLAWLWANEPGRLSVLGDYAHGYILSPSPPDILPRRPVVAKEAPSTARGDEDLAALLRQAVPHITQNEAELLAAVSRMHSACDS